MADSQHPDPPVLSIQSTGATDDQELKYDIYYFTGVDSNGTPQSAQVNLCGFSFFGEIAGRDPEATGSTIRLWCETDPEKQKPTIVTGGEYSLLLDDYLQRLQTHNINYLRLFLFQEYKAPSLPFEKHDLKNVSEDYLTRLDELMKKARARGIVVCLSFFSDQMLSVKGWPNSPFNVVNGGLIDDVNGLVQFFDVTPVAEDATYESLTTDKERLFWVQRNLVKRIVKETKPYWNVIYELFNEPGNHGQVVEWFGYLADWVNSSLGTPRSRLVSTTALDNVKDALLAKLTPDLIDIFSFHGAQWGGAGGKPESLCMLIHDPTDGILNGAPEFPWPPGKKPPFRPGINQAIENFPPYPLALIFDTDALYWAEKYPTAYATACITTKNANFNYRWSGTFIDEIAKDDNGEINEFCDKALDIMGNQLLGLEQRLGLVSDGVDSASITDFPQPPADTPTGLQVTIEIKDGGPQLRLTCDPFAARHGYLAAFGPTTETIGTGTDRFPAFKPFGETPGMTPELILPFAPKPEGLTVYVAVAARNGFVPGDWSAAAQASLPATPKGRPTNLKLEVPPNTAQADTGKATLRLTFDPVEGPHDGYVAYFGRSPESVGTGAGGFPPEFSFAVSNEAAPQFDFQFTPVVEGPSIYVAVAARNGIVTGSRSDVASVPGDYAELVLTETNLPVGYKKTIETREDFRGDQYYMTFRNLGVNKWLGKTEVFDSENRLTTDSTLGVYLPIRELASGLSLLFIPLKSANGKAETDPVLPGDTVRIHLNEMNIPFGFEEYDLPSEVLLPYSRQALSFEMGIGRVDVNATYNTTPPYSDTPLTVYASYGHLGHTYFCLNQDGKCSDQDPPPADRQPIRVKMDNPQRRATQVLLENDALNSKDNPFKLAMKRNFDHLVASLATTQTAAKDTIIRTVIELANPPGVRASAPAVPERRVLVSREGSTDKPQVAVSVVLLDPIDLYYAGSHVDPQGGLYDVPAGGGTPDTAGLRIVSLQRFEDRYTLTSAFCETPINASETINWSVRPGCDGGQTKQLVIANNSKTPVKVDVFTADIWEDIPTESDTLRQVSGMEKIESAGPNTVYVDLGQTLGDASKHHFCVATMHAESPATINYDIVLKADDGGKFLRMLEIYAKDYQPPLIVNYKVLDVIVKPNTRRQRRAADLSAKHAARILEFFNRVTSAHEIVSTIHDNPAIRLNTPRAYGIRQKLAEHILEVRDALPGRRFTSVSQIDDIRGVGGDTFEDIAYTFEANATPAADVSAA